MNNSILIFMGDRPFTVLLVNEREVKTIDEILDIYAEWCGLDREVMTGAWIHTVDITSDYPYRMPTTKNEWPTKKEKK